MTDRTVGPADDRQGNPGPTALPHRTVPATALADTGNLPIGHVLRLCDPPAPPRRPSRDKRSELAPREPDPRLWAKGAEGVLYDRSLSAFARVVWLALERETYKGHRADHRPGEVHRTVTVRSLAGDLGLAHETVANALADLAAAGHIAALDVALYDAAHAWTLWTNLARVAGRRAARRAGKPRGAARANRAARGDSRAGKPRGAADIPLPIERGLER